MPWKQGVSKGNTRQGAMLGYLSRSSLCMARPSGMSAHNVRPRVVRRSAKAHTPRASPGYIRNIAAGRLEVPRPLAQHVLLDLAGRGLGKLAEDHGARDLDAREVLAAAADDLLVRHLPRA